MAVSRQSSPRARQQLYLVPPPIGASEPLLHKLRTAFEVANVAAVLVRLPAGDHDDILAAARPVVAAVQQHGAAALIAGRPELVAPLAADGAHFSGLPELERALPAIKSAGVVGVGAIRSRHDAMLAGEAGVDYVMFGDPDASGRSLPHVLELVTWWVELFEIPCVAFAESEDEFRAFAGAGAEFVAVGDWVWSMADPARALMEMNARLSLTEELVP